MDIGISTASYFSKLQTEDALPEIGAHGVSLCEVFLNSYSEYEPAFFDTLAERVRQSGLRVFSIHPMSTQFEPQLFSIHPRQRGDAMRLFEQVLAGGRLLGATHYVMHGPIRLFGGVKNISLTRIAPIFADLIALAKEYGITLTLENVSWCVFNQPAYGTLLLDAVGGDALRFTLDVKQALRAGYDPLDFIREIGDRIVNVHLCDAKQTESGVAKYVMPGFGDYDFTAMFDALSKKGYLGPAFLEVYSDMYDHPEELYQSYSRMCLCAAHSGLCIAQQGRAKPNVTP